MQGPGVPPGPHQKSMVPPHHQMQQQHQPQSMPAQQRRLVPRPNSANNRYETQYLDERIFFLLFTFEKTVRLQTYDEFKFP